MPRTMPANPSVAASNRNITKICRPFIPNAARMPISRVRSNTDISSVLAMTTATTANTTRYINCIKTSLCSITCRNTLLSSRQLSTLRSGARRATARASAFSRSSSKMRIALARSPARVKACALDSGKKTVVSS